MKKSTKIIIGIVIIGLIIGAFIISAVKKQKDLDAFYETEAGKELQRINNTIDNSLEESERIENDLEQFRKDYYWIYE